MEIFNAYTESMVFALIVIFSYFFSYLSMKTKIPSVLLLIGLGIGMQALILKYDIDLSMVVKNSLELLGIIGLIIIILEASLELKINREKKSVIIKTFLSALLSLVLTTLGIAYLLTTFMITDMVKAMFYAIPLAVVSSEIVIPGVTSLLQKKKEFLVYESTFSGILGIMFFYVLLGSVEQHNAAKIVLNVSGNIVVTLIISLVISYVLVWFLNWLKLSEKLFFLIAILVFLYSVGKMLNLSALLIILVFGLLLNNYSLFFRGKLSGLIRRNILQDIMEDFTVVTKETSFLIKTFFFVIFGMTLDFKDFYTIETVYIVAGSLLAIYIIRYFMLKSLLWKNIKPQLWIVPRGFISVLLFFSIPESMTDSGFNPIILLIIILATSLFMFTGMIWRRYDSQEIDKLSFEDWDQLDNEIRALTMKEK